MEQIDFEILKKQRLNSKVKHWKAAAAAAAAADDDDDDDDDNERSKS